MPATPEPDPHLDDCRNEVSLVGRVRRSPLERQLPSGDTVVGLSVRVPRPGQRPSGPRGTGDSIELGAWTAALRRKALTLESGDLVEVTGALRRQVRSAAGVPVSRYEVEVATLRRLSRASG